jgi:uncharacterized membrane-anchored protein YhcB (DUF1043 family)
MRLFIILVGLLIGIMLGPVFGAEPAPQPQPATTEVLELRKALLESQMQNMANQFAKMQEQVKELGAELEKRKAGEKKVEVKPEKK